MLKNVFANSFALTSRLSHLPSAAARAGQGLRAHPGPKGSSPWPWPGHHTLCPLGPCWHLCPQLSFVLAGNEKGEEVGSEALQGCTACQPSVSPSGCVPALHPGNLAIRPCRSCPSCPACGSVSRQGFPPRHPGVWDPPLPRGWEGRAPRAPLGCRAPPEGVPPPTCLCSGFSLTFSPSSAQWIYFYLHRLLLICPRYYPSLPPASSPPLSQLPALVPGLMERTGRDGGLTASPRPFSPRAAPEGRRRSPPPSRRKSC